MSTPSTLAVPSPPRGFGFSSDHELSRREVRRFLEDRCPVTEVRRLAESATGFDAKLWSDIAELGWIGLGAPESVGGSGLGSLHVALLFEEMGRALLPSPFLGTWLALEVLGAAGSDAQKDRQCPALVQGKRVATVALVETSGAQTKDAVRTRAEPVGGHYELTGVKTHVMFGASAHHVLVPAREPDGRVSVFVVDLPSPNVRVEPESALDGTRRTARVTLESARVPASARLDGDGEIALDRACTKAYAMLACEMIGGADRILGITRDYAISRIQFGRPIGAFQAVKHPIVDGLVGVEQARSLALGAASVLDIDISRAEPLARAAKAYASDVYMYVVKKGVQLHGGYGFTWDCDVHLWFKRAVVSRGLLGDPVWHRGKIAEALFAAAPP